MDGCPLLVSNQTTESQKMWDANTKMCCTQLEEKQDWDKKTSEIRPKYIEANPYCHVNHGKLFTPWKKRPEIIQSPRFSAACAFKTCRAQWLMFNFWEVAASNTRTKIHYKKIINLQTLSTLTLRVNAPMMSFFWHWDWLLNESLYQHGACLVLQTISL